MRLRRSAERAVDGLAVPDVAAEDVGLVQRAPLQARDARALGCQPQRNRMADSPAGTGDNDMPIRKKHGGTLPFDQVPRRKEACQMTKLVLIAASVCARSQCARSFR
jgi:hypothetical protein